MVILIQRIVSKEQSDDIAKKKQRIKKIKEKERRERKKERKQKKRSDLVQKGRIFLSRQFLVLHFHNCVDILNRWTLSPRGLTRESGAKW